MTLAELLVAAGLCAVLFVVFGYFRPAKECSGDCGSCTGTCPPEGGKH